MRLLGQLHDHCRRQQVRRQAGWSQQIPKALHPDTGATDHIRNDASKFISFDAGSYHAVSNTGAGPMTVKEKNMTRRRDIRTYCVRINAVTLPAEARESLLPRPWR
jgi:hypothetical protein